MRRQAAMINKPLVHKGQATSPTYVDFYIFSLQKLQSKRRVRRYSVVLEPLSFSLVAIYITHNCTNPYSICSLAPPFRVVNKVFGMTG